MEERVFDGGLESHLQNLGLGTENHGPLKGSTGDPLKQETSGMELRRGKVRL